MSKQKTVKGFTLIEILVVVALIAILTAITFIAINPAKNFADTRNAQRSSDVTQILNAVTQYTSEQGRSLVDFTIVGGGAVPTCPTTAPIGTATGSVDISALVPTYIVGIPLDPQLIGGGTGDAGDTGYTICTTVGRVQIDAPNAEGAKAGLISVKR
jgi:prepilin-type N-terminal cleavage/methylation domain-containing protein